MIFFTATNSNKNALTQLHQQNQRMTTVLGASLEVIIHELLYLRGLYFDHDDGAQHNNRSNNQQQQYAYASTRYLGVACHACRHPGVVDYIFKTLEVAIPAICSGVADELLLIFYDTATDDDADHGGEEEEQCQILETFVFSFQIHDPSSKEHKDDDAEDDGVSRKIQELQRSYRDVLLKLLSVGTRQQQTSVTTGRRGGANNSRSRDHSNSRNRKMGFSDSTTFKLCLHCSEELQQQQQQQENGRNNNDAFHTPQDTDDDDITNTTGAKERTKQSCPDLETALSNGTWRRSESKSCTINATRESVLHSQSIIMTQQSNDNKTLTEGTTNDEANNDSNNSTNTRPLKSIHVPSCGLKMQLLMESPE